MHTLSGYVCSALHESGVSLNRNVPRMNSHLLSFIFARFRTGEPPSRVRFFCSEWNLRPIQGPALGFWASRVLHKQLPERSICPPPTCRPTRESQTPLKSSCFLTNNTPIQRKKGKLAPIIPSAQSSGPVLLKTSSSPTNTQQTENKSPYYAYLTSLQPLRFIKISIVRFTWASKVFLFSFIAIKEENLLLYIRRASSYI